MVNAGQTPVMTTVTAAPQPVRARSPRPLTGAPPSTLRALPRLIRTHADIVHVGVHTIRLSGPGGQTATLSGSGVLALRRLLALMNGQRSTERLLASLPCADRPAVRELLARLLEADLLRESGGGSTSARRVAVVGEGRLAARLRAQLGQIASVESYGDALAGGWARCTGSGDRLHHWTELADQPCDLVVWAPAGCVPDPALAWSLLRANAPHLVVMADGMRGRVSPLVLPGVTACLECQSSHASWPRDTSARARLVTRIANPHPTTLDWAVGVTGALALAHLRSGLPTRGSDIEGRNLVPSRPARDCGLCGDLVVRPAPPLAA